MVKKSGWGTKTHFSCLENILPNYLESDLGVMKLNRDILISRLGYLTAQRKHFVETYCRLGNGTLAAKEAGYIDSSYLVNKASKQK